MLCACGGLGCQQCGMPFNVADAADLRIPELVTRKVAVPDEHDEAVRDDGDDDAAVVARDAAHDTDEVGLELMPFDLDLPPVDWLAGATTDRFRLDELLNSPDDVVLGDAADVVASFVVSEQDQKVVHVGVDVATLVEGHVVLRATDLPFEPKTLSPFERFVLQQIDGSRCNDAIAQIMKVTAGDLRVALALLIDKRVVERVPAEALMQPLPTGVMDLPDLFITPLPVPAPTPLLPPLTPAPTTPEPTAVAPTTTVRPALSKATTPLPTKAPFSAGRLPTGAVLLDGRHRAASLHAQVVRELKNGKVDVARGFAEQALEAAPDVALHKDTLAKWDEFVAAHVVADDARSEAQAIRAAELGDPTRAIALLRNAVAHNPRNAAVWNRLAVLLATRERDFVGAVDAAAKALELAPNDATYMSNFAKFAAVAEKHGIVDGKKRGLWKRLLGN